MLNPLARGFTRTQMLKFSFFSYGKNQIVFTQVKSEVLIFNALVVNCFRAHCLACNDHSEILSVSVFGHVRMLYALLYIDIAMQMLTLLRWNIIQCNI